MKTCRPRDSLKILQTWAVKRKENLPIGFDLYWNLSEETGGVVAGES